MVARPFGGFKDVEEYHYQTLRCNADLMKTLQLGMSFSNAKGMRPTGASTWQFNFRFNLGEDMFNEEIAQYLAASGVDFSKHQEFGIEPDTFGEVLMTSGLVLSPNVTWITAHGGYDFGFFLRITTASSLAADEDEFREMVGYYFPKFYDIRYMLFLSKPKITFSKLSLEAIADEFGISRSNNPKHAGNDALLTLTLFWEIASQLFDGHIEEAGQSNLFALH